MPDFITYKKIDDINIKKNWDYESTEIEVDNNGKPIGADYNGKKYKLIQAHKNISFIERSARAFFGTVLTILTLGTVLFSPSVRNLFTQEKRSFKAGLRIKPEKEPKQPRISFKQDKEKECEKEKEKEEELVLSSFEQLPAEVAGLIFQHLPNSDVFSVERASKECQNSVLANDLWKYERDEAPLKLNWAFAEKTHDPERVNFLLNKILFEYLKMRVTPGFSVSAFVHSIQKKFKKYSILKDFPALNYFLKQESRFFRNKKVIRNKELENEIWKKSLDPKNSGERLLHLLFKNFEFYSLFKSKIKYGPEDKIVFIKAEHKNIINYLFNNLKKLIESGHSGLSLYAFHIPFTQEQRLELAKFAVANNDFSSMETYLVYHNKEVETLYCSEEDCSPPVQIAYAVKLNQAGNKKEASELFEKGFSGYGNKLLPFRHVQEYIKLQIDLKTNEKISELVKYNFEVDKLLDLANHYYNLELTLIALELFILAQKKLKNDNPELFKIIGACHFYVKNFEAAISSLEKAVKLEEGKTQGEFLWIYGMASMICNDYGNAYLRFQQAIDAFGDNIPEGLKEDLNEAAEKCLNEAAEKCKE